MILQIEYKNVTDKKAPIARMVEAMELIIQEEEYTFWFKGAGGQFFPETILKKDATISLIR